MVSLINPSTSRLGISNFWVNNFIPTIISNYTTLEKYKYQNYVESMHNFCFCFFSEKCKFFFSKKLFFIFSHVTMNALGFPGTADVLVDRSLKEKSNLQYFKLNIKIFDFYMHVFAGMNWKHVIKYKLGPKLSSIFTVLVNYKNKGVPNRLRSESQFSLFFKFLKQFVICINILKKMISNYLQKFELFLKILCFKSRIMRIHNYFFRDFPLLCILCIIPFNKRISAKFLCHFIERKMREGVYAPLVLSLVVRFLKYSKRIKGLRIICAGRFARGNKARTIRRVRGHCTYGSFNVFNKLYTIDYAEISVLLRAGLCGIRVWVCSWSRRLTRTSSDRKYNKLSYGLRSRYNRKLGSLKSTTRKRGSISTFPLMK